MAGQRNTGDLAQTSVGSNISFTGTTTIGSAILTAVSSTTGLAAGQPVTGAGIPAGATILAIGSGTVTLSASATAAGAAVAIAAVEQQVIGLMEWSIPWKRKTVDSTTTDDGGYEAALGSTASWTGTAKYAYLQGDPSQSAIRAIIATLQTTPQKWNFFAVPGSGNDSYSGNAYIDGITIAAGVGKIVGFDISLKGTGPLNLLVQTATVTNAAPQPVSAED